MNNKTELDKQAQQKGARKCPSLDFICRVMKYTCILDADLNVVDISQSLAREMGASREKMLNGKFTDFVQNKEDEFISVMRSGQKEAVAVKLQYRRKAGQHKCTPAEMVPFYLDGGVRLLIHIDNSFEMKYMLEWERNERVKELKCLYLLGSEMETAKTLDELLLNTTGHIKNGMQFPNICSTTIALDGKEYSHITRDDPPIRSLTEPIILEGKKRGTITVRYHQPVEFLHEEAALISSIAKMLARVVQRFELEQKRIKYMKNLEVQVEERFQELEKSRRRYMDLFDNAPTGITISTRGGEIINANRAFYRMLKYPEDGSVKLHVLEDGLYVSPPERDELFDEVDKKGRLENFEFDLYTRNGDIITVNSSIRRFEEDGKVYYENILKDITEKKALEQKLRKQKDRLEEKVKERTEVLERQKGKLMAMNRQCKATSSELRSSINKMQTLFDAITDSVISIDRDFNIVMTNRTREDLRRKCHEVLFNSDSICENCPALKAIKRKRPSSIEVEKEGRYYQMQCYPIFDSKGNVEGVIEWAKDITRDKSLCEQMLQTDRLASLGQLVSGIGHEINNPNTFILGNMKILHEAMDDIMPILDEYYADNPDLKIARLKYEFFKEHIRLLMEDMVSGAERIKTIVQDLKKFARKGDDRFDSSVSVNRIIQRSIRLVHNQVKRKAAIETDLDESLPLIRANSTGLEQVLVNLIINAYDALKDGGRNTISINTSMNDSKDYIIIKVKDDGAGMDTETMRQIFNPFFTTKRNRGGTGLGLSIVYRIVKEHDGDLEVESEPGKGSVFTIELPVMNGKETE